MTMQPPLTYALPPWPTRDCAPWCIDGPHDSEHPDDRVCKTDYQSVPLSLQRPVKEADHWCMDQVDVYLRRVPEEEGNQIVVYYETANAAIAFTPAEAQRLATTLVDLLALEKRGQR